MHHGHGSRLTCAAGLNSLGPHPGTREVQMKGGSPKCSQHQSWTEVGGALILDMQTGPLDLPWAQDHHSKDWAAHQSVR